MSGELETAEVLIMLINVCEHKFLLNNSIHALPVRSLVRRHPAGDVCFILPLSVVTRDVTVEEILEVAAAADLDLKAKLSGRPKVGARKGQLFCPLQSSTGKLR